MSNRATSRRPEQLVFVVALQIAFLTFSPGRGYAQSPTAAATLYELFSPLDEIAPVVWPGTGLLGPRGPAAVGNRSTAWGCEGFARSSIEWETASVEVRLVLYDNGNPSVLLFATGTANYWGATYDAGWVAIDDADHPRTISCEITVYDFYGTASGSDSAEIPAVPVAEASQYALMGEGDLSGTPGPCQGVSVHYWKWRDYQVRTAGDEAIPRVMKIDESFTTGSWTCAGPRPTFYARGGYTDNYGMWRDNIYFCGIFTCDVGGQCELERNQTWKAEETKTLTPDPMRITYRCNAPSFWPW